MNKQTLISDIAEAADLPSTTVRKVLDAQAETVSAYLHDGDDVSLPGIGKLKTAHRPAREGRNPQTGETVQIAARTAVTFTAAKALKDAVNA